jgi:hypothetical protein
MMAGGVKEPFIPTANGSHDYDAGEVTLRR